MARQLYDLETAALMIAEKVKKLGGKRRVARFKDNLRIVNPLKSMKHLHES